MLTARTVESSTVTDRKLVVLTLSVSMRFLTSPLATKVVPGLTSSIAIHCPLLVKTAVPAENSTSDEAETMSRCE
jgi:hypothetical protein